MTPRRCHTVQAVVTESLFARIRALAIAERKSVSAIARRLICEGLRARTRPPLRIASPTAPLTRKVPT